MATFTSFLALRKPSTADNMSVELDLNENFEKIDDKLFEHEERLDKIDGEAAERQLSTGFDGGVFFPGEDFLASTGIFSTDGTRRIKADVRWIGRCTAAAGTGHAAMVQRSTNGGAFTDVGDIYFKVYPTSGIDDSVYYQIWETPPAGSHQYRIRIVGHGINGNAMSAARLTIWDVGYDI
jgi:hypothetical protein